MKITFLGTGTSQGIPVIGCKCATCQSTNPFDQRLRASVLVETNGQILVIDAGPDFRQQMLRANVENISAILLTHEHYDHIAGLDDIRAFNWIQKKDTDIYAEKRVLEAIQRLFFYVFSKNKYPGVPQMELHEIDEHPFTIENTCIIPVRGMHHKLPILGFRIESFAYITDMKTIETKELDKLHGLEVFVINALRKESHISHSTLHEALEIIDHVKPRRAYITHISHQMGPYNQVSPLLPPGVSLACDGLELYL
ncbi:MAG TPA: MBL fold metallo-hydrolase [Prolixibacteraceae bacterium]|nr:MBL fold metallo-hydrolase [Prolixibacteraceae bacterium]